MSYLIYNRTKANLVKAMLDWEDDTIKILLVDADYTPNADHNFVSDVVSDELPAGSGTAYERKTLASKTVTQDDSGDRAVMDAEDVTWTALNSGTIGAAIVYKEVTNDADSFLICCLDPTNVVTSGNDVTFVFHASNGVFTLG